MYSFPFGRQWRNALNISSTASHRPCAFFGREKRITPKVLKKLIKEQKLYNNV